MSYGKIYETTNWGKTDSTINWGSVYHTLIARPLASTTKIFADTLRYLASNLFS